MIDTIVVGGGIAGLAAAYELHRRRVRFLLLEQRPRLGGVILSEKSAGYVFDAGADALLIQKQDGIKLCEELGLADRLVTTTPPRLAYVQRGGVLHQLPDLSVMGIPTRIAPFLKSRLISWAGKARMGAELFVPRSSQTEDESIGAFMTRRFGREAATYIAEPLLAGIHAGDVDRLSIRALFPRFAAAEETHGSLIRALRKQMKPSRGASGPFRSFPGGMSELTQALQNVLPPRSIRLNTVVRALASTSAGTGFRLETSSGETLSVRSIVLATPAFETARLTRAIDPELSSLCDRISYMSTSTIALAFRRSDVAHPLNGSGFVVPKAEGTGILASSWMSSKWPDRAPADHVLLRAFIGGARDPQALDRSDSELVSTALRALTPLLGITASPLLTRVYRWERAIAQHEIGHLARVAAIDERLSHLPGLFLTGSGFRGTGIPDCIADARATAAASARWLATQFEYAKKEH
jgi:oxygen-dependent protoporphyrinogen oxidase